MIPTDLAPVTQREADDLFLVAVDGAEAAEVVDLGSFRAANGTTWTHTSGNYDDGQSCNGWHVRDADGEFVEFVADTDV